MVRRSTIGDVAREASVSIATVSRVLNGEGTVNKAMAEAVRAAVEKLGYQPNAAARGLASGAYRTIGVVVPDLGNPYFTDILAAIVGHAATDGYRVIVADANGDPAEEFGACQQFASNVDGLMLISPRMEVTHLQTLSAWRLPVVLVNRHEAGIEIPMILADTRTATYELCRHLSGLGHERVVYINGSPLAWQSRERLRGIRDASEFGFDATVIPGSATIDAGYHATPTALEHRPTAIMAFSDLVAFGVVTRLHELGFRVPDDISVTGFDDIEIAHYLRPSLTTAVSPKAQLGERAWRSLKTDLDGDPATEFGLLIPSPVVIRESTAPARTA